MEEENRIQSQGSDLSLSPMDGDKAEVDPLASKMLPWGSRYKCFQAYMCLVMSFLSSLRFCERVGNYKVTIFVPYLLYNIFIGVPALTVEIMLGRFVMANVSAAWNMCPLARGVFWCLFVVTFYSVIPNYIFNIYLIKYFFSSFHAQWETCTESWNKANCYSIGEKVEAISKCLENHTKEFCHNLNWETSGTQFWKYKIHNNSDALEVFLSFLFLAITTIVISAIIYKGIVSLEKMLGLLVYPATVIWAIFVIVSFSAPNVLNGFKKLFDFYWSDFMKPQMWVEGFEDTFYFLGLGRLSLSFISSHGKFTDDILFDVVVVVFGSAVSCLLITTPILSVIANTKSLDGPIEGNLLFKDETDVFISMSEALLFYPEPVYLWSSLYFLDCLMISLSSQAILVLSICEALQGVLNVKEKSHFYITLAVSVVFFIVAGSVQFVEFICEISHATALATTVILCTITWQLFYGIKKFNYDYYFMMGYPVPLFLKFTWITLFVLPIVGMACKMYYKIPRKPLKYIVYIYFGIIVFIYLLLIVIYIVKFRIRKEKISNVFKATPDWGPENALLKKSRLVFDTSLVTREFMYRQELYKKPFIKPPDFSTQNIVQLI